MISVFIASIIITVFLVYNVVLFELAIYIKVKNKLHIYIFKFAQT